VFVLLNRTREKESVVLVCVFEQGESCVFGSEIPRDFVSLYVCCYSSSSGLFVCVCVF